MGKSGNFCPGLRLALTLKRVPAGPKIASFLAKNAHSWRTSSPRRLLTENGRISQPNPRSLVGTHHENSLKRLASHGHFGTRWQYKRGVGTGDRGPFWDRKSQWREHLQ